MGAGQIQIGRRIVVVGTCGCGKTYLARALATRLNIPYICNDALIWRAGWVSTPREQRNRELAEAIAAPAWTFDGNIGSPESEYNRLVAERMDTFIWLDLPCVQVWRQMLTRTIRRITTREELWHGNRETWMTAFMSNHAIFWWSLQSFNMHRRQYTKLFAKTSLNHVQRIRLTSTERVNSWLEAVSPVSGQTPLVAGTKG